MRYFCWMACILFAFGCSSTWKSTKEMYDEYVVQAETVDIEDPGTGNEGQLQMARVISRMDERLFYFLREFSSRDTFPGMEWFDSLLGEYPWLSGTGAVDTEGEILVLRPETSIKPVDFLPLLDPNECFDERSVRGAVVETEFGPEVYVGEPFFRDGEWMGLLTAHFDMRALVRLSPVPDDLLILSRETVLWPGKNFPVEQLREKIKWDDLEDTTRDEVEINEREYFWLVRYVGQMKIVYVVAVPEEQ